MPLGFCLSHVNTEAVARKLTDGSISRKTMLKFSSLGARYALNNCSMHSSQSENCLWCSLKSSSRASYMKTDCLCYSCKPIYSLAIQCRWVAWMYSTLTRFILFYFFLVFFLFFYLWMVFWIQVMWVNCNIFFFVFKLKIKLYAENLNRK